MYLLFLLSISLSQQDAVAKLQDERELAAIQQTSSSLDKGDPLTSSSSSGGGGGVGGSGKPKIKSKQLALIAGSIKTKRKRYVVVYQVW